MQQWFQIVDVEATADITESDCDTSDYEAGICTYYESLTCSFQYSDKIVDGNEGGGVTIANSIIQGYKGVYEMKDAIGAFSDIVILNKTSTYPWFIDYERSSVIESSQEGTGAQRTQITCSVFRDFITDWSEIAIKGGDELTGITGYRIYSSATATSPGSKGYSEKFTMQVLDGASTLASAAATALVLSALI